jgi:CheY-like chemotaxis protein
MPRTLLLADDSVTIQKVVGISFANEDVRLVTVDNGDDAVIRVREERPDLVLADVVMPGKSGYEVCEAIKSDADLRHIPVLLLSGTFEAFDDDRAQRAGADGHITKPFEAQTLVDRVNQLLASAPGAASSPEASSTDSFDFFEDEGTVADAGETTVVASDDLEFGAGDEAFVFESPDPLSGDPLGGDALSEDPLSESNSHGALTSDLESPMTDPWGSDLGSDRSTSGAGLEDLGLESPADPVLGQDDPDPLLDSLRDETSPADAVRALGLDSSFGSLPRHEPAQPSHEAAETRVTSSEFDVSSSDLGEPLVGRADPEPQPSGQVSTEALRSDVVDALEKIAWEAFGELTEQLVKQTVAKVEAIAWEVIPEMAERLVREEIEKLKS